MQRNSAIKDNRSKSTENRLKCRVELLKKLGTSYKKGTISKLSTNKEQARKTLSTYRQIANNKFTPEMKKEINNTWKNQTINTSEIKKSSISPPVLEKSQVKVNQCAIDPKKSVNWVDNMYKCSDKLKQGETATWLVNPPGTIGRDRKPVKVKVSGTVQPNNGSKKLKINVNNHVDEGKLGPNAKKKINQYFSTKYKSEEFGSKAKANSLQLSGRQRYNKKFDPENKSHWVKYKE
jgi:hypothetical protein